MSRIRRYVAVSSTVSDSVDQRPARPAPSTAEPTSREQRRIATLVVGERTREPARLGHDDTDRRIAECRVHLCYSATAEDDIWIEDQHRARIGEHLEPGVDPRRVAGIATHLDDLHPLAAHGGDSVVGGGVVDHHDAV